MAVVNEQIVTGRKFRKLIDERSRLWLRCSFWTKACDVEFNDGETAETKFSNMTNTINNLKTSFQIGVNKIFNYLKGLGFTPSSNSPDGICDAIQNVYNKRYTDGRTQGQNDVKDNPGAYGLGTGGLICNAWEYNSNKLVSANFSAGTHNIEWIVMRFGKYAPSFSVDNMTTGENIFGWTATEDNTPEQHPQSFSQNFYLSSSATIRISASSWCNNGGMAFIIVGIT